MQSVGAHLPCFIPCQSLLISFSQEEDCGPQSRSTFTWFFVEEAGFDAAPPSEASARPLPECCAALPKAKGVGGAGPGHSHTLIGGV